MLLLRDHLKKSLEHKKVDKTVIASIALNAVSVFFSEKNIFEWYLKFNKLFIKTTDPNYKMQIFLNKKEILTKIHDLILKLGYKFEVKDLNIVSK